MLTKEERDRKINALKQYVFLGKKLDSKLEERSKWRDRLINTSAQISDMPRGTAMVDKISVGISNVIDLLDEIEKDINTCIESKKQIEEAIESMDNQLLETILRNRYIDNFTFEKIAYINAYSWRQVHRLHDKAIEDVKI